MITREINNKTVYITFCDDIDENAGGYFCQVYADSELTEEIDSFAIPVEIVMSDNIEDYIDSYCLYYCQKNYV